MTTVGVVSDVVPCQNGGRTFGEIFSRCESCMCMFDGISGPSGLFLEEKMNSAANQLKLSMRLKVSCA